MTDRAADDPYAASPFRLNLEQQRKRAKDPLAAWREGRPAGARRYAQYHPAALRGEGPAGGSALKLSDAQVVIARELGSASWPRLKAHIEASARARDTIAHAAPSLDGDMPTLHIRCGSDIQQTLRDAGFTGSFLEYSDPFCCGPVIDDDGWLAVRADHIARSFGRYAGLDQEASLQKLRREEADLHAASRTARVVLWFEHDIYDQSILARILCVLADARPMRVELVSVGDYPGSFRYIGLGQLPPEALRMQWERRKPVRDPGFALGRTV